MSYLTQAHANHTDRWLTVARVLWVATAILGLALFVAAAPGHLRELRAGSPGAERTIFEFYQLSRYDTLALSDMGLSPGFFAGYIFAFELLWLVLFWTAALAILWRRPGDRMALFVSFTLMFYGVFAMPVMTSLITAHSPWGYVVSFGQGLSVACLVVFLYIFPDGRFVPRWTRWWGLSAAVATTMMIIAVALVPAAAQPAVHLVVIVVGMLGCFGPGLYVQAYRYRRVSTPVQRQQTKWVVFGILAAYTLVLLSYLPNFLNLALLASGRPRLVYILVTWPIDVLSLVLLPLTIGVSILRYRLWDIDLIIRRTLVYGVLTVALALIYFGSIILLQSLLRFLAGQEQPAIVNILSTLAIYAAFGPLRRWVQSAIDRRFYRRRYDAARAMASFSATARDEMDLTALADRLAKVVEETMQPASLSLWVRPEAGHKRILEPAHVLGSRHDLLVGTEQDQRPAG